MRPSSPTIPGLQHQPQPTGFNYSNLNSLNLPGFSVMYLYPLTPFIKLANEQLFYLQAETNFRT